MCTPSRQQQAKLVYFQWQDIYDKEKPFQVFANVPAESKERLKNLVIAHAPAVDILDLGGNENNFILDNNGFKVFRHHMPENFELKSREYINSEVGPYLKSLVRKQVKDADLVKCFDWGVGCSIPISFRFMKHILC
jgi:hypothetical protein